MKVIRYKFFFILAFILSKICATYFYYINLNNLDYADIFESFCSFNDNKPFVYDLLNSFHYFIFIPGCGLGMSLYFWLFALVQLLLLTIVFNIFYKNNFAYKKLILIVLFFSPTILFFSSPPTKDGFFIFFTCIAILFNNKLRELFLFISGIIKPYLLALAVLKINGIFIKFVIFVISLLFVMNFYDEIFNTIFIKFSVFSPNLTLSSFLWIFEMLLVFIVAFFSGNFLKKDLFFILFIAFLAAGVNFNVGSRIIVVCLFYLLVWRLQRNARA